MRVGIFGGTFDPVHHGHLTLAEGAVREVPLDQVLWVPARISPHKPVESGVSAEDRYRMVELAVEGHPHFQISRVELDRNPPSYTIDTVRLLQREAPKETEWFFLLGFDAAAQLLSWREIDELKKLVRFVVIPRSVPGTKTAQLYKSFAEKVPGTMIDVETLPISASEIRRRIAQGCSIEDLTPKKVCRYIEEHHLYR